MKMTKKMMQMMMKMTKPSKIELSGAGDIARINAGVDPYTGEELSDVERVEALEDFAMGVILKPAVYLNKNLGSR